MQSVLLTVFCSVLYLFWNINSEKQSSSSKGISCFGLRSRQSTQDVLFLTPHPLWERYEGEVYRAKGCCVFQETSLLLRASSRWQHSDSMQHITSPLLLQKDNSESHTKRPHMHIELSDPLRRPGQWCFKSGTTLGSLLGHSCGDRIGSETSVGLKIGLLFF